MSEFKYDVVERFGNISDNNGWTKEVNLIQYGNGSPKLDIRSWHTEDDGSKKMSKGITLNKEEAKALSKLLQTIDVETLEF